MRSTVQRCAAGAAAIAYAVLGVVVPWKGTGEGQYVHSFEYVIGYALAVAVIAVAVAVGIFRERSVRGPQLVRIGAAVLAVGVMWGNLTGDDPAWFVLFGGPGNLLMLAGLLLVARALWRDGGSTRAFAVLLALTVPLTLAGAELGGGFVGTVTWGIVALGLVGDALRPRSDARPAAAPV